MENVCTLTIDGETKALFTLDETARLLSASRPTVYRLIRAKRLTTIRLGRRQYVTAGTLARLLDPE